MPDTYDAAGNLISEGGKIGAAALGGFTNPFTDISALVGAGQTVAGLLGLSKTPDRVAPTIDPKVSAMVDRSLAMAKQGYSPEQIAAFKNNVAENDTARFRHGTDMAGGNLASAENASNNAFNTDVFNKFASGDAALKEAHQHYADQSVKYLQGLENQDWQKNETYRKGLETAWGGAAKQGLSTLTGALTAGAAGFKGGNTTTPAGVTPLGSNDLGMNNIPNSSNAANFDYSGGNNYQNQAYDNNSAAFGSPFE